MEGGPSQLGVQGELRAVPWQGTLSSELLSGAGHKRSSVVYSHTSGGHNGLVGLGPCLILAEMDGVWY